jgi:hypothetical protein
VSNGSLLSRWFHQCSYLSFEAKLKRYGFQIFKGIHRCLIAVSPAHLVLIATLLRFFQYGISDGPRQSAFYHRKFLKDQPNLALTIQKLDPKRASRHGRRVRAVVQPREGLVPMPLWDVYSSRVPAAHAAQTSRHTNKTSTSRRNGACATDWRAIPHLSQPAETLCTASGRLIVPDENFSNHPNHSTDAVDDRLSAALMAINLSQGKDRHSSAGPAFKHERT